MLSTSSKSKIWGKYYYYYISEESMVLWKMQLDDIIFSLFLEGRKILKKKGITNWDTNIGVKHIWCSLKRKSRHISKLDDAVSIGFRITDKVHLLRNIIKIPWTQQNRRRVISTLTTLLKTATFLGPPFWDTYTCSIFWRRL